MLNTGSKEWLTWFWIGFSSVILTANMPFCLFFSQRYCYWPLFFYFSRSEWHRCVANNNKKSFFNLLPMTKNFDIAILNIREISCFQGTFQYVVVSLHDIFKDISKLSVIIIITNEIRFTDASRDARTNQFSCFIYK